MDGCMRRAPMSRAHWPPGPTAPQTPAPCFLAASPASAPAGRPSRTSSRPPGSGSGPNWAKQARDGDCRTRPTRHRRVVRPARAGGPGDRLRNRHVDPGHGAGRARHRRRRRRGLPARPGPTAQRHRPCSETAPVTNIRLIRGDGVDVLTDMFGPGLADRCPGVLPRPVAQGAPPQAATAATATRWRSSPTDSGPAGCCTPPPTTRDTPSRSPRSATPNLGCAGSVSTPSGLPISVARPVTKYERKALAGTDVAELLWERT